MSIVDENEIMELHQLNVELLDTLIVIGERFLSYVEKHDMKIEKMDTLAFLIGKAYRIMDETGTPYQGNPIRPLSERHGEPPDNAIECPIGGSPELS